MSKLSRRSFLFAATASVVALGIPTAAYAGPVITVADVMKRAQANALKQAVSDGKTTMVLVGGDVASYGSAVGAEVKAASGLSVFRTFGGVAGRLGMRMLGPIGIILTVAQVGIELYNWQQAKQREQSLIESCEVGSACVVTKTTNGQQVQEQYTHTIETNSSQSNWSLFGARGGNRWGVVMNKAPGSGAGYAYDVWWKYNSTDPFKIEYTKPIPQSSNDSYAGMTRDQVEALLKKLGDQTALDRQTMADTLNKINDRILAANPTNEVAKAIKERPIQATDVPDTLKVGHLLDTWPDVGSEADRFKVPTQMIDGTDTQTGNVPVEPGTTPTTGTSPTPTPTTGTQPIDWGTPPTGTMPSEPTHFNWMPTPWVAPNLPGSCTGLPYDFTTVLPRTAGLINPCPVINLARPVVRPVAALGWTAYAISLFLDL